MICRTLDPTFLNSVANHPEVRPWLGGEGELDLAGLLGNVQNYGIEADGGGWLLQHLAPGEYELHTLFLPEARGMSYFRQAREALRWVFTRSDCTEILTKCPDDNPPARMAAVKCGFRERFHRENAWKDGVGIGFYALTIDDWFVRDAEALKAGRWFHHKLETEIGHPNHADDDLHDRAVGAAVLMIKAGMIGKGVACYNRWARFAGFTPIIQIGPHTLDIQTHVLEVENGDFAVLLARG